MKHPFPRIGSRRPPVFCMFLAILAFTSLLTGCGNYFAPDRNVKEKLTESDAGVLVYGGITAKYDDTDSAPQTSV